MAEAASSFDYSVDARDTVTSVSDAWTAFARENGAPHLGPETVVGRALWEFVAGESTRVLYEMIFHRVRRRRTRVTLPFRCDSPDRFRFMELLVEPGEADALDLRGVLIREQARPHLPLLDFGLPRSEVELVVCSVCLRVLVHGTRWTDTDEAVARLGIFETDTQPKLWYSVCEDCRALAWASA